MTIFILSMHYRNECFCYFLFYHICNILISFLMFNNIFNRQNAQQSNGKIILFATFIQLNAFFLMISLN